MECNVISPECGHAYAAIRWDGPNFIGRAYTFEVIHILECAGMGCIFIGLIVIDGRVLSWIKGLFNFRPKTGYHFNK